MTLESYPVANSSINGNLLYVVYDAHAADSVTYPNYKYVAEIWISGTKVFTSKAFPHPTTNRGIFDFGSIIREYAEVTLAPTMPNVYVQEIGEGEFYLPVVIKIREEYSGTIGAVVLTDSERIFYNYYNGRISGFESFSLLNALKTNRPLTNLLIPFNVKRYYIPYYIGVVDSFDVEVWNGITTATLSYTTTIAKSLQLIDISPAAINRASPGTITSTTPEVGISFPYTGEAFNYNLICDGNYQNYSIHFLNKWGGFETFVFNKTRRQSVDIEKKLFQQLPYRIDGSGVVSVANNSYFNIMHSQVSTYYSRFKEKLKLSSDWISDEEYIWLQQLVVSPLVYLEDNDVLYPVTITETNYEIKEYISNKLSILSITIEFGQQHKTQFR